MPRDDNQFPDIYTRDFLTKENCEYPLCQLLNDYKRLVQHLPISVNEFHPLYGNRDMHRVGRTESETENRIDLGLRCLEIPLTGEPYPVRWLLTRLDITLTMLAEEISEFRNWLPWKFWKTQNAGNYALPNRRELQMEVVDMLHFVLDLAALTGMSGSELTGLLRYKMNENKRRWREGY